MKTYSLLHSCTDSDLIRGLDFCLWAFPCGACHFCDFPSRAKERKKKTHFQRLANVTIFEVHSLVAGLGKYIYLLYEYYIGNILPHPNPLLCPVNCAQYFGYFAVLFRVCPHPNTYSQCETKNVTY